MYGTLKPVYNKFSAEDKSFYKMYYCGLCSALGRLGGPVLRMALSYDVAFMYMMLDTGNEKEIKKCFCPGRIICKRRCIDNNVLADYMAAVSLVLMRGKCRDNINDREKILQSRFVLRITEKNLAKMGSCGDRIIDVVKDGLEKISLLESSFEGSDYIDIANQFGILCGKLFEAAPGLSEPELFYKLGYWLGRWIYIADAALDISADAKNHRFNPFLNQKMLTPKKAVEEYEQSVTGELFKAHDCVVDVLKLIDSSDNPDKLINIVSLAMSATEGSIFKLQEGIKNA